jgi:hypothetical protein
VQLRPMWCRCGWTKEWYQKPYTVYRCSVLQDTLVSVHLVNSCCVLSIYSTWYGHHITMAAAKQTSDMVTTFSKLADGENNIGM